MGLALLVPAVLAVTGCDSATGLVDERPNSGFGRGVSGAGSSASSALVGIWQAVVSVQVPGDFQAVTTTWQFNADGTCRETQVTGTIAITDLACTWTSTDTEITVTFANGGTRVMPFSFAGLALDLLVLDGFAYQRPA